MTTSEARRWLGRRPYLGRVVTVALPVSNKELVGRVVSINPHPGTHVCGPTELRLNVGKEVMAPSPPPYPLMPQLSKRSPRDALEALRMIGEQPVRVEFRACNRPFDSIPEACDDQFRVVNQWPPAGTPVDPKNGPIRLQLERIDDSFLSVAMQADTAMVGTPSTCGAANGGPSSMPAWTVKREEVSPTPGDARTRAAPIERRMVGTVVDRLACEATLVIAETTQLDEPARPVDGPPVAPMLFGGAVGGALLCRLWPRGKAAVVPGGSPGNFSDDVQADLRVELD
ncbi:MAG: hypothetical protein ABL907_01990, partial [Hyphomicrobium sp.]